MKSRKTFLLRISPELYRELDAWAQQEMRSINGQIEYLLRQAVLRRKRRQEEQGGFSGRSAPQDESSHGSPPEA